MRPHHLAPRHVEHRNPVFSWVTHSLQMKVIHTNWWATMGVVASSRWRKAAQEENQRTLCSAVARRDIASFQKSSFGFFSVFEQRWHACVRDCSIAGHNRETNKNREIRNQQSQFGLQACVEPRPQTADGSLRLRESHEARLYSPNWKWTFPVFAYSFRAASCDPENRCYAHRQLFIDSEKKKRSIYYQSLCRIKDNWSWFPPPVQAGRRTKY